MIADTYDRLMLALAVWREARGEPLDGKRGVAWVILNRMADPRWPDSAAEVVTQPWQFSCFNAGDPNATKYPTQKRSVDWAAWLECCVVVDGLASDLDPTSGANHYEAISDSDKRPNWADPVKITRQVGRTRFYRI